MGTRFETALGMIDAANAPHPDEVLYGRRMRAWLEKLAPEAPEHLKLAARAQHVRRWEIPREKYPKGREGYLKWRTELYGFHADVAAGILKEAGYDAATIDRVRSLLMKKDLRRDPEMQLLEDVICLVFLEFTFADFSVKHEEEKIVTIVRKTWRKMGAKGREAALTLPMSPEARRLVERALGAS